VVAVGKDLGLQREEGAAGVDEIYAGEVVLRGDLLRAQVLLDRDGEVRPALHGGVVGDDHHLEAGDAADAGDQPGAGGVAVVEAVRGRGADLQERAAWVEQAGDPVAWQHLAAPGMALRRLGAPAGGCRRRGGLDLGERGEVRLAVGPEGGRGRGGRGDDDRHYRFPWRAEG
jgi:hypothetical protein